MCQMERKRLTVGLVVAGWGRLVIEPPTGGVRRSRCLRLMRRPWPGPARVSPQVQSRKQEGEVFECFYSPEAEPRLGTPPDRGFSYALLLILSLLHYVPEADFGNIISLMSPK